MILKKTWFPAVLLFAVMTVVHFHDPQIFHRDLIDYDDKTFISPIQALSFQQYFSEWLFKRESYAFPVRDLTYVIDFRLSESLGFQTHWISTFLYFWIFLFAVWKIIELTISDRRLKWLVLGVLALHPLNVEVIQWLFIRKHLLAGLFVALGTWRALQVRQENRDPGSKDWGIFLGCYVASLLCWNTPTLWIFWILYLFRDSLKRAESVRRFGVVFVSLVVCIGSLWWTVRQNDSYSQSWNEMLSPQNLERVWFFGTRTLGRATLNLFAPFRIVTYYDLDTWLNLAGLALFVLLLAGAFVLWRKRSFRSDPAHFLILAALLFAPQLWYTLTNTEFVYVDRYLFVPFPYFLIGAIRVLPPMTEASLKRLIPVGLILLAFYSVMSFRLAPTWRDDYTVFDHCVATEPSPKCISFLLEKAFDRGGCPQAFPMIEHAKKIQATRATHFWDNLSVDLPLYEGVCLATSTDAPQVKWQDLQKLRASYGETPTLIFNEVLLLLEMGKLDDALTVANHTVWNPAFTLSGQNKKIINVLQGQAEFLCMISSMIKSDPSCKSKMETMNQRLAAIPRNPKQIAWALNMTSHAFNQGNAGKPAKKKSK